MKKDARRGPRGRVPAGPPGRRVRSGRPKAPVSGNLSLSGAWALYPMALKWVEEFQKIHPGVRIDVQAGRRGQGHRRRPGRHGRRRHGLPRDQPGRDRPRAPSPSPSPRTPSIPTLSARIPLLKEILKPGASRGRNSSEIWITKTVTSWADLVGRKGKAEIHVYTRSDACGAAETWAAYMGKKQEDLGGIGVYGDPGLADAVKRDPLGIGFNNVNFAYDAKTLKPIAGIADHAPSTSTATAGSIPAERRSTRRGTT